MNNMKVHVLDTGYLEQDRAMLVGPKLGTIHDKTPAAEWTQTPVYAVLIEHPDGLVLFDTSCSAMGMTERWTESFKELCPYHVNEDQLLLKRLEQLNFKPSDVKYVVASHLHIDHSGGLEYFTEAEIIVHDTEFTEVMKKYALNSTCKDQMGVYVWDDINAWIQTGLHWKLIKPTVESVKLLDGITILNFGSGHAHGMLGLLLELPKSGNILLSSDAIYTSENFGPPIKIPGIVYDTLGYVSTIEKIREIATEKNAQIWYGHDKDQFATMVKSPEGYYE